MQDTQAVIVALKRALKKRKMTYATLGEHLGISEAGVKKMFLSADMPLGRMMKICKLLNVSPETIFNAAKHHPFTTVKLNHEQSDYFIAHPEYFYFFLKLVYERSSPEEIADEFKLTKSSLFKYLKKLDDLGLIILRENNKVEFRGLYPLAVDTRTYRHKDFEPMRRNLARAFMERLIKENPDGRSLKMSSFRLSEEKIEQLNSDLERLFARYKRISEVERVFGEKNLHLVTALAAMGRSSFISGIGNL